MKKKKGFTLVELLVVIAILAVLATVSVVGYMGFTKKAQVSNDTSLVAQLNLALQADEVEDGQAKTPSEALEVVEEAGYIVPKLTPTTAKYNIIWNQSTNRFALLDEKGNKVAGEPSSKAYENWTFVSKYEGKLIDDGYSAYLNSDFAETSVEAKAGVDVGENSNILSVKYMNENATFDKVLIRTNNGETNVEVNAKNDTVYHYGVANEVKVIAVDVSNSYHEFGSVKTLEATKGHIVLEKGSLVFELKKSENADSSLSFENSGAVIKNSSGASDITPATSYDIYNLEQLCAFRDYVNAGMDFSNLPVEIKVDIDMSSIDWMPIGTGEYPFNGTINGNNHTLRGLTNGKIVSTKDAFTTTTTKTYGASYGFIAIAGSLTSENSSLNVQNLNFEDAKIELEEYGNCVGTLLGYAPSTADFADSTKFNNANGKAVENIAIKGVSVSGTVNGNATVGGIAGKLYNPGNVVFEDCSNSASVSSDNKAGGLIGYISGKERLEHDGNYDTINITLKNLKNTGTVTANSDKVGGIVSYMNTFCVANNETTKLPVTHILVENCSNSGAITGGKNCAGVGGILYSFQGYKTGYYKTSESSTVVVKGCVNTGTLTNEKDSSNICVTPSNTQFGITITNE